MYLASVLLDSTYLCPSYFGPSSVIYLRIPDNKTAIYKFKIILSAEALSDSIGRSR